MPNVVMPNVIMLSVIMPNVVMLNVVAPSVRGLFAIKLRRSKTLSTFLHF